MRLACVDYVSHAYYCACMHTWSTGIIYHSAIECVYGQLHPFVTDAMFVLNTIDMKAKIKIATTAKIQLCDNDTRYVSILERTLHYNSLLC